MAKEEFADYVVRAGEQIITKIPTDGLFAPVVKNLSKLGLQALKEMAEKEPAEVAEWLREGRKRIDEALKVYDE